MPARAGVTSSALQHPTAKPAAQVWQTIFLGLATRLTFGWLPGYFQPNSGQTSCLKCTTEKGASYDSPEGATNCSMCVASYFRDNAGRCQSCPEGIVCTEAGSKLENLIIEPGWFRYFETSTEAYRCPQPLDCIGGNATGSGLCSEAAHGYLCSSCKQGFYIRDAIVRCKSCLILVADES